MRKYIGVAAALLVVIGVAPAAEYRYPITAENTSIKWTGTKKDGKHVGGFGKLTGLATLADGAGLNLSVTIDCNSLYSDNDKLTQHLKAPDFFSVKAHPTATFKITRVEKEGDGYRITGELTLLGKKKEVRFPARITAGDTLGIKATFTINRSEWGMTYGKGMIDDAVEVQLDVNARR